MAVHRGFVEQIEVGRAGRVRVRLFQEDGSHADYFIRDIDGDPERFNERLSKLAILRDAMDLAEPVEIEHTQGEGGDEIDRAVRITRDALATPIDVESFTGIVISLSLTSTNRVVSAGEEEDVASVQLIDFSLDGRQFKLGMQPPERAVATEQFEMLADAQRNGTVVTVVAERKFDGRIVGVSTSGGSNNDTGGRMTLDVFVESLGILDTGFSGLAVVTVTTAPAFTGVGNVIANDAFQPQAVNLLVARGSEQYELCEAGLRDNVRMSLVAGRRRDKPGDTEGSSDVSINSSAAASTGNVLDIAGIILDAKLLAPLASASRPVWVMVSRETLDVGIEGPACTEGVPSSDLAPKSLRDLHIPYPAKWCGVGCFNHGVYRFQFKIASPISVTVDCRELCLYESDDKQWRFGYACLGGEHTVCVSLPKWTCEQDFNMDIYRIR